MHERGSFCVIFIHFNKILHACVFGYYPLGEACLLTHSSNSEYFSSSSCAKRRFLSSFKFSENGLRRSSTIPGGFVWWLPGRFAHCGCAPATVCGLKLVVLFWPKLGAAPNLPAYGLFRSGFLGRLVRKCSEYGSGGQDSHPNHDGQCPKSTRRNDG